MSCNIRVGYVKINGKVKRLTGCFSNWRGNCPVFITDYGTFHNGRKIRRFTFNTHKVKILKNNNIQQTLLNTFKQ